MITPGHGGSYRVDDAGELQQVEAPTRDHPQGNRPRAADGAPLDLPPAPEQSAEQPPPEPTPIRRRSVPAIASLSGD